MQDRFQISGCGLRRARRIALSAFIALSMLSARAGSLNVEELGKAFDKSMKLIDASIDEQRAELTAQYLRRLREIQISLESQGLVRGAVTVFDEISRCEKARVPPTAPVVEPVELRDMQIQTIVRMQQIVYSNEAEVVRVASRYLQALAQNRSAQPGEASNASDRDIDAERTRVLAMPRLRAAIKATVGAPPDPMAIGSITNSADLKFRSLKLSASAGEELSARISYELQATLAEDDSKLRTRKSVSAYAATHSEDGVVSYKPRFTVTARGDGLPGGCRLAITYFSRSLTDRERKRENSEYLDLPALEKGGSYTSEGQGLTLVRSYANTTSTRGYTGMSMQGSEWYGLIVELQDADGRVMLHRCSPQSLDRELERDSEKSAPR